MNYRFTFRLRSCSAFERAMMSRIRMNRPLGLLISDCLQVGGPCLKHSRCDARHACPLRHTDFSVCFEGGFLLRTEGPAKERRPLTAGFRGARVTLRPILFCALFVRPRAFNELNVSRYTVFSLITRPVELSLY